MLNIKKKKNEDDLIYLERVYTKILKKDPGSFFYLPLASVYYRKGSIKRAIYILKIGLSVHPNYETAKSYLAFLYYKDGEIDKAVELFKKAALASPDNYSAHKTLAQYYIERKDDKFALMELKELERLAPFNMEVRDQINRLEHKLNKGKSLLNLKKADHEKTAEKKKGSENIAFQNKKVIEKEIYNKLSLFEEGNDEIENGRNKIISTLENWLKIIDKRTH